MTSHEEVQSSPNDPSVTPKVTVVPTSPVSAVAGGVVMGVSKLPSWKYFRRESVRDLLSSEFENYLVALLADDAEYIVTLFRFTTKATPQDTYSGYFSVCVAQ